MTTLESTRQDRALSSAEQAVPSLNAKRNEQKFGCRTVLNRENAAISIKRCI
jgi:hypothetical protein